jgi:hypothetical protein
MFILFNGNESGSPEARLVEKVPDVQWGLVKRNAVRILRTIKHETEAADALEKLPFELWKGANGFGDQFELLYVKVPINMYLEIELEADTYRGKARWESIAEALEQTGNRIRFIGMDADTNTDGSATISTPQLLTKSVAVTRALSDFEVLTSSNGGPISAFDRIHTALHGYLKAVCDEAGFEYPDDADIAALFALIRERHPKFQTNSPGMERTTNILRGMARVVDALNPVRNRHSMAHPTEELLHEPEAMLGVNAVKSLLHYVNMKLR